MKKILFFLLVLVIASCSDPCKDVDCGINGICEEGTCICEIGVHGTNCELLYRDDFEGSWTTSMYSCDVGNALPQVYTFSAAEGVNEIEIRSSITPDFLVTAKVDSTSFVIEPQVLVFGIPVTYTGTGTLLSANSLELILVQEVQDQPTRTCTYQCFK